MKTNFYNTTIFLLFLLNLCGNANAQSPKWLLATSTGGTGDDNAVQIAVDPSNGDTYTTGYFKSTVDFDPGDETFELTSNGEWDMFISKLDASGNFIWAKSAGSIGNDYGTALALDASGNIILAGSFGGELSFEKAGIFDVTSIGGVDMYVTKLDAEGNFLWARSMGGTLYNFINSIGINLAGNGDIYATGRFLGTTDFDPDTTTSELIASDADGFIFKLDNTGDFVWAHSFGSPGFDFGNSLVVDPAGSGDVFTTGKYQGTVDFNPDPSATFNLTATGNQNTFISRLDESGNFIWAITMDGINNNYGSSITIDPSGDNIYTTGLYNGTVDFDPGTEKYELTANGFDAYISKLDDSGNFVWAKGIGGGSFDIGYSIVVDPAGSGDVYTMGFYGTTADFDPGTAIFNLTSEGGDDIFISKLDEAGNFVWAKSIGGPKGDYSAGMAFDMSGHLNVAGYFIGSTISLDSALLTNVNESGTTADFFNAKLDASMPSAAVDITTNHFSVFPNPLKNELTIDVDEREFSNASITLFNSLGEACFSLKNQNIIHNKTIDVSTLPAGVYFIELNLNGEKMISKVVKE